MPEGPEVKIITEQLAKEIQGKYLRGIWSIDGRYQHSDPEGSDLIDIPCKILEINCKGKFIYWKFDNDWSMWNTLGMTGEWSIGSRSHPAMKLWISEDNSSKDGFDVFFNDIRHFGTMKFVKGQQELIKKLNSIGYDMLSGPPDDKTFASIIMKQDKKSIAEVLMNQKYFSGVGNYIKSEALYRAGISPWRYCAALTFDDLGKLRQSIIDVMTESYAARGATLATYKTVSGDEGSFASQLKVYGKKFDPKGNPVTSEETLDKRTSWWVPSIQK